MRYDHIRQAIFLERPNRFIAYVELDGKTTVCHVKNTGRCKELLIPGAQILIQKVDSPQRKTLWDLIAVRKGQRLINMDANAPNRVFGEWLANGGLGFIPEYIQPEYSYEDSRFDFYFEHKNKKAFAEIKGVTLEENNVARFPDAPTKRGAKHLRGLTRAVAQGFEAYAVFVIQMQDVRWFEPNWAMDSEFCHALQAAQHGGVHILAMDCLTTETTLELRHPVKIKIEKVD